MALFNSKKMKLYNKQIQDCKKLNNNAMLNRWK